MCNLNNFERKLEQPYSHSKYIAEFWNTLSNLPFIIIGIFRLYEAEGEDDLQFMYHLFILCGFCSAFHHATTVSVETRRWTLLIDWAPITVSIYYILFYNLLVYATLTNWILISLALLVLLSDHVCTVIPVPWGHSFWHVLAALAIDTLYTTIRYERRLEHCWEQCWDEYGKLF